MKRIHEVVAACTYRARRIYRSARPTARLVRCSKAWKTLSRSDPTPLVRKSPRRSMARTAALKWLSTGLVVMFAIFALFFVAGPGQERRADSAGAAALAHIKVGMSFEEAKRSLIADGFERPQILVYKRITPAGPITEEPSLERPEGEAFGVEARRHFAGFNVQNGPEDINVLLMVSFDASGRVLATTYNVKQAYL